MENMIYNFITYIIIFAALAYSVKSTYSILFNKKSKCAGCASGDVCKLKELNKKLDY